MNKFKKLLLQCSSCNVKVTFDLIDVIECDWGLHQVIQCPNCQELFSIDHRCPAFSNVSEGSILECCITILKYFRFG